MAVRGAVAGINRAGGFAWAKNPGQRDVRVYFAELPAGTVLNRGDIVEYDAAIPDPANPDREKAQNPRLYSRVPQQVRGKDHGGAGAIGAAVKGVRDLVGVLDDLERLRGRIAQGLAAGSGGKDARAEGARAGGDAYKARSEGRAQEQLAGGRAERHRAIGHAAEIRAGGDADKARSEGHAAEIRAGGEVANRELEIVAALAQHAHEWPDAPGVAVARLISGFDPNSEHAAANARGVVDIYHAVNEPGTVGQAIVRRISRGGNATAVVKWTLIGLLLLIIVMGLFGCSPGEARRDILRAVNAEQVRDHQFRMACLKEDDRVCVGITDVPRPQIVQPAVEPAVAPSPPPPAPAPAAPAERPAEIIDLHFDVEGDTVADEYGVERAVPFDQHRSGAPGGEGQRFEVQGTSTPLFTMWKFRSPWPRPQKLHITFALERCDDNPPPSKPPSCVPYAQESLAVLFDDSTEEVPVAFGEVEAGNYRLRALREDGTEISGTRGTRYPAYFSIVDPPLFGRVNENLQPPVGLRSPGVFFMHIKM